MANPIHVAQNLLTWVVVMAAPLCYNAHALRVILARPSFQLCIGVIMPAIQNKNNVGMRSQ